MVSFMFSHVAYFGCFAWLICLILLSETLCACSDISLSLVSDSLPVRSAASCREQKHHSSVEGLGLFFVFLKQSVTKVDSLRDSR